MNVNNVFSVQVKNFIPDVHTYTRLNPKGWFVQPMISSSGRQVLYWGKREREVGYHIWRSDIREGERKALTAGPSLCLHPFWSADDRTIVYARSEEAEAVENWHARKTCRLCIMDSDGGNQRILTDGTYLDERPCINPEGDTVVFVSNRSGSTSLWALDLPSGRLEPVTRSSRWDYRPIFSPDGTRIAFFTRKAPLPNPTLCLLDWQNRTESFPLSQEAFEWIHGPFWLSDGKRLLVHAKKDSVVSLWVVDLEEAAADPRSGGIWQLSLRGFRQYGHGSLNRCQTIMVFDSPENSDAFPHRD
jgi:TolB protein